MLSGKTLCAFLVGLATVLPASAAEGVSTTKVLKGQKNYQIVCEDSREPKDYNSSVGYYNAETSLDMSKKGQLDPKWTQVNIDSDSVLGQSNQGLSIKDGNEILHVDLETGQNNTVLNHTKDGQLFFNPRPSKYLVCEALEILILKPEIDYLIECTNKNSGTKDWRFDMSQSDIFPSSTVTFPFPVSKEWRKFRFLDPTAKSHGFCTSQEVKFLHFETGVVEISKGSENFIAIGDAGIFQTYGESEYVTRKMDSVIQLNLDKTPIGLGVVGAGNNFRHLKLLATFPHAADIKTEQYSEITGLAILVFSMDENEKLKATKGTKYWMLSEGLRVNSSPWSESLPLYELDVVNPSSKIKGTLVQREGPNVLRIFIRDHPFPDFIEWRPILWAKEKTSSVMLYTTDSPKSGIAVYENIVGACPASIHLNDEMIKPASPKGVSQGCLRYRAKKFGEFAKCCPEGLYGNIVLFRKIRPENLQIYHTPGLAIAQLDSPGPNQKEIHETKKEISPEGITHNENCKLDIGDILGISALVVSILTLVAFIGSIAWITYHRGNRVGYL